MRANKELAEAAGLETNRGVIVNDRMQTSAPNILAVGDVAELPGAVGGLWAGGTAQAAVAVAAMFGQDATYEAPSTLVSLKMDGIDVKGFGKLDTDDGAEEFMDAEESENIHRRLVIKDGRIQGAVFVGPPGTGKDAAQAIQKRADVAEIIPRLRDGDWAALADV